MEKTGLPSRIPRRWADTASSAYVRPIPVDSQIPIADGAASLTDGFVPLNATPISAGGIPPDMRDMNGILQWVTEWVRWQNAGGQFVPHSVTFASAVGGYPQDAVVASKVTAGQYFRSTTNNNVTDPDAGGAGWVPFLAAGNLGNATVPNASLVAPAGSGGQNTVKGRLSAAGTVDITMAQLAAILPLVGEVTRGLCPPRGTNGALPLLASGVFEQLNLSVQDASDISGTNNGYVVFGPILFNWGRVSVPAGGNSAITWAKPFSTYLFSISGQHQNTLSNVERSGTCIFGQTNSGASVGNSWTSASVISYFAIGLK